MSKPDGGPAFAMSIRDAIAVKAMQGILSGPMMAPDQLKAVERATQSVGAADLQEWVAIVSYQMADAMLAERSKT